jgi:hypothetical protein
MNRIVSYRQTDEQIDMMKLIIAFQNFGKSSEKTLVYKILNLIPTLFD